MSISFIHTADIHFGIENYGYIDSRTGLHTRLLDFNNAFDQIINYAIVNNVDAFIFAGDAYKNSYPNPTHQRLLLEQFIKLAEANIQVVITVGNHDYPGNSAKAHALDIFSQLSEYPFHLFDSIFSKKIITKSGLLNVIGVPWPSIISSKKIFKKNDIEEYVKNKIKESVKKLDPTVPCILVGHLTMKTGIFSGSEKNATFSNDPLFDISDIAISPVDYVALGHLHRFQEIQKLPIPIIYSGSPEKIDFGEERDEKSFVHGIIESKKCIYSNVFIKTRKMFSILIKLHRDAPYIDQFIKELDKPYEVSSIIKIKYIFPLEGPLEYIDTKKILYYASRKYFFVAGIHCLNKELFERKRTKKHFLKTDENKSYDIAELVFQYAEEHEDLKKNAEVYKKLVMNYIS